MPAAPPNGAYTSQAWGHGQTTTSMPGALDFANAQSYLPPQSQQQQQGTFFPPQQQQIPGQNFHQGLQQQQHGHGQLPHQQRNVELEHHYAPIGPSSSSSQTNGSTMSNMGMTFDDYSLNFNPPTLQQYPSPPLTGPSQPQALPQTTPPLTQYDPRQQHPQHIPPHQLPVRQQTNNAFRHHQAAFNTGTVTGGGPPAAAPPAYVEQTATAIADGHSPAGTLRGSPNSRALGMNSKTPSPKSLPGALGGANGTFNSGFTFTSPGIPGPLPQIPSNQQMLGPSVYTPHLPQQPALKRGRYDLDGPGYEEGDEEGDVSGEVDHDFDFSMQGGGQQQYGQQPSSSGSGEQQGQDGDQKRPAGACVRCKNLKVRCEFTTGDPQTCRRCMNGGHECSVPGKKKRKQPPKREHLINEIRSQASEIKDLMEKLEIANKKLQTMGSGESAGGAPTAKDATMLSSLGIRAEASPLGSPSLNGSAEGHGLHPLALPRPDVQAWIMRARESIEQISGMYNGAPVGDEDDDDETGEESDSALTLDEDAVVGGSSVCSEESFAVVGMSDRDDGSQFEGEVTVEAPLSDDGHSHGRDDDAYSNAEHPPPSDIATDDEDAGNGSRSTRHVSPATTVRSVSTRSGSAAPQRKGTISGGSGVKARTVSMGAGAADPLKLISSLHIARMRSTSPGVASRAGSVEKDALAVSGGGEMSTGSEHGDESGGAASETDDGGVKVKVEEGDDAYGAAGKEFFHARRGSAMDPTSLAPSRNPVPHILIQGIVSPEEVEKLFKIYFEEMNLSCSLLDPVLYTAQATYWRSPFLFTVMCTVASRYYTERPNLYSELTQWAQLAAGTALISGPKTVETVAAYILLSLYPIPMRRWEEDRTWMYLGLAIRVATDINLHHPIKAASKTRSPLQARELANRTRVWLNCFNLDRSTSSWMGKMSTIGNEDYIATHCESWYNSSEVNLKNFDIQLVGYNACLRVVGDFRRRIYNNPNNPSGFNKDLDICKIAADMDDKMQGLEKSWTEKLQRETDLSDPQARFRNCLIKLAYRNGRLVILLFGFEDALAHKNMDHAASHAFFQRCYAAATQVVNVFLDELSTQKRYLRHGPEAQCVFVTFASAFLIKILHPKFQSYVTPKQRKEIREFVSAIAKLLNDPEVVVDEKHSPHLWAKFLEGLLQTPMAKLELSPGALKHGRALPQKRSTRRATGAARSPPPQGNGSSSATRGSANGSGQNATSPPMDVTTSPSSVSTSLSSPPPLPTVPEEGQVQTSGHGQYGYAQQNQPPQAVDVGRYQQHHHHQQQVQPQPPQHQQNHAQMQQQQRHQQPQQVLAAGMPSSGMNVDDASFAQQQQQQQQQQAQQPQVYQYNQNALQMDMPELFTQPFPFMDNDMIQSMQTMPESEMWRSMNTPGFNWFGGGALPADVDTQMGTIDPGMLNMNEGMSF